MGSKIAGAILERLAALATSASAQVLTATDSAVALLVYATTTTANALVQAGAGGTFSGTFLPTPSSSAAGGTYAARLIVGRYYVPSISMASTTGTNVVTANQQYAVQCPQISADTYSAIAVHVSTVAAAGKKLRLSVFANSSTGLPGARIWYSADTVCDTTTGVYSLTFASGTWTDTAYKTGNNLTVPFGSAVWLVFESDGAPTLRATVAASTTPILGIPTASFATVNCLVTGATAFAGGPPNPFGAATYAVQTTPIIALLVV